jgi:hypothetical protein
MGELMVVMMNWLLMMVVGETMMERMLLSGHMMGNMGVWGVGSSACGSRKVGSRSGSSQ